MMSVHWVKADMRLRASRSDFDPRVRPLKPTVGGGQISGAYRRRTGGPGSYAKFSVFKKKKDPLLGSKATRRPMGTGCGLDTALVGFRANADLECGSSRATGCE